MHYLLLVVVAWLLTASLDFVPPELDLTLPPEELADVFRAPLSPMGGEPVLCLVSCLRGFLVPGL